MEFTEILSSIRMRLPSLELSISGDGVGNENEEEILTLLKGLVPTAVTTTMPAIDGSSELKVSSG